MMAGRFLNKPIAVVAQLVEHVIGGSLPLPIEVVILR